MKIDFSRIYRFISIPLTIMVVGSIFYLIFIDKKPRLFVLLLFTILALILVYLSLKFAGKHKE